jgi:GR25 family glycosyltransferase involved in LPS biosynthesis
VIEKGYKNALVFEDDVRLLPGFTEKLAKILEELEEIPEWDYVNLGAFSFPKERGERVSLSLVKGSSYSTHCYIISRKGAQKLASWDPKDFHFCIDTQIARTPLKMYYADPVLAHQETSNSSILGLVMSMFKGDVGLHRTFDWDLPIRLFFAECILFIKLVLKLLGELFV